MTRSDDFLQVYDLKLTAFCPVFIGDGGTILKKSYLYDSRTKRVLIFDEKKFFGLLFEKNLADQYETFMLGASGNLFRFLTQDCHLTEKDWLPAVRYTVDAGAALDANHAFMDIHSFIRNAFGQPYVPGSSVKGALRTVLLQQMILRGAESHPDLVYNHKTASEVIPEEKYLHTLQLSENSNDMINSIMRGISITDSLPISDQNMTLFAKLDAHIDGSLNKVNVCRESICPGTEIQLKLILDQSVLKGVITKESIVNAIDEFNAYYCETYLDHFYEPDHMADVYYDNCLILGGGAGFFSKSLAYPYLNEERALRKVSDFMIRTFRGHNHEKDFQIGISPHTVKYAQYAGGIYPVDMCGVQIQ